MARGGGVILAANIGSLYIHSTNFGMTDQKRIGQLQPFESTGQHASGN